MTNLNRRDNNWDPLSDGSVSSDRIEIGSLCSIMTFIFEQFTRRPKPHILAPKLIKEKMAYKEETAKAL